MDIRIRLLGIGGVEIDFDGFSVYVDAFNDYIKPPGLRKGDIVLFTHDDADHFYAPALLGAIGDQKIIGPPSIAYPLLAGTGLDPALVTIVYPPNLVSPIEMETGGLGIKVYQTTHFNGWQPPHISFLLSYHGKKIYITGDSITFDFDDCGLYGLDALIYSMIPKELRSTSVREHVMELREIQERLNPACIIGNHLIGCEWAVSPADLKQELMREDVRNIAIPQSEKEEIPV